jgi:hypothetical protein
MRRNLGATVLPRRRERDPMRASDALPPELRDRLAQAALSWSPRSCARLWRKALRRGLDAQAALAALDRAQARTLARERAWGGGGLRA